MAIPRGLGVLAISMVGLAPGVARAGLPECGNIRIEAGADCRLEQGAACGSSCGSGAYARSCSTELFGFCRDDCSWPPDPACTDSCTETCDDRCTAGIQIVCHDNCFPECVDECAASCDLALDTIQCRATCEATCDGECEHQCAMLPPDANCYDHCLMCCGGACDAAANVDCQIQCQSVEWTHCQSEQQAGCEASCEGEGALFCDGQLVASGAEVAACAAALSVRGIAVDAGGPLGQDALEDDPTRVHAFEPALGCTCRSGADGRSGWMAVGLGLLGLLGLRRRRTRVHCDRITTL